MDASCGWTDLRWSNRLYCSAGCRVVWDRRLRKTACTLSATVCNNTSDLYTVYTGHYCHSPALEAIIHYSSHNLSLYNTNVFQQTWINPLTPNVAIWVQLCQLHPVPHRVMPSFAIFDIRTLWRSGLSVLVSGCQKLQMTA